MGHTRKTAGGNNCVLSWLVTSFIRHFLGFLRSPAWGVYHGSAAVFANQNA